MVDALKRLDRLTQEEAQMAAAETLKLTHTVDKKVEDVAETVVAINSRVAGVDDRVAGVDERVAGVDERLAGVDDRVAGVDDRVAGVDGRVADVVDQVACVDERVAGVDDRVAGVDERVASVVHQVAGVDERVAGVDDQVQQTAYDVDEMKRLSSLNVTSADYRALPILSGNQFRESVHKWLSPPDPSTNHNIACGTHNKKTANWFFQGSIFQDWKSSGSLLWINGKRLSRRLSNLTLLTASYIIAGSGKSVIWFVNFNRSRYR